MRNTLSVAAVGFCCLVLLAGCGVTPGGNNFTSNAKAVEALGGTQWADADNNVTLSFDANGKLIGFTGDLPSEVEGLRLDGQPFTIRIPEGTTGVAGVDGQPFTVTLENTSTIVGDDNTTDMEFSGTVDGVPILGSLDVRFNMHTSVSEDGSGAVLNDPSGTLSVIVPILGEVEVWSGPVGTGIPVVKL